MTQGRWEMMADDGRWCGDMMGGVGIESTLGGRPVRVLRPNRVRNLLGVWSGGGGGSGVKNRPPPLNAGRRRLWATRPF